MYRFLLKPRWIAFHLLVVALMVIMVMAAFWQLRRWDSRKGLNLRIRANAAVAVVPIDQQLSVGDPVTGHRDLEWRQVSFTGSFDSAREILINSRSFSGSPGFHVVTPMTVHDAAGQVTEGLLVNRGWIPLGTNDQRPEIPAAPTGPVTVTGRIRQSQTRGALGPKDPPAGTLERFARVDLARIGRQLPYRIFPVYVELMTPAPTAQLPRLIPAADLSEGPHLSYMVQWFIFTLCAAVGWVLVVRKSAAARLRHSAP